MNFEEDSYSELYFMVGLVTLVTVIENFFRNKFEENDMILTKKIQKMRIVVKNSDFLDNY